MPGVSPDFPAVGGGLELLELREVNVDLTVLCSVLREEPGRLQLLRQPAHQRRLQLATWGRTARQERPVGGEVAVVVGDHHQPPEPSLRLQRDGVDASAFDDSGGVELAISAERLAH